jgi:hypothetical protein
MKQIKVIIALNGAKKRNVGKVIDVLEKRKFTFINKESHSYSEQGLRTEVIDLRSICKSDNFIQPLMQIFPKKVVERKIHDFIYDHVQLTFETEKDEVNVNVIKEYICMTTYPNPKKRPLLSVSEI